MIKYKCIDCGFTYEINEKYIGKTGKCKCGRNFIVSTQNKFKNEIITPTYKINSYILGIIITFLASYFITCGGSGCGGYSFGNSYLIIGISLYCISIILILSLKRYFDTWTFFKAIFFTHIFSLILSILFRR